MDKIKISVSGNIAVVAEKPKRITSGTTGLPVEFTFDSEWDKLRKVAVFDSCCVRKDMIIKDGATVVPIENLAKHGDWLCIGVYGVNEDGSIAIPTIWANAGMIYPGAVPEGDLGSDIGTAKEQYDAAVLASERSENAANRSEAAASEAENNAGLANDAAFRADAAMVSAVSASESAHQSEQNVGASVEYIEIQKYNINQSVAEAKNAQHYAEEAQKKAEDAADRAEAAGGGSGGGTIIVGIDEGNTATHTASEIYDAIQNKQTVVFHHTGRLVDEFVPLKISKTDLAVFSKAGYPTEFDIFDIEIDNSGTISYNTHFSSDLVNQAVEKVETDLAPVSYLPQTLTTEQQAQARENIGAVNETYVDNAVKGKSYELIETIAFEKDSALQLTEIDGIPIKFSRIMLLCEITNSPGVQIYFGFPGTSVRASLINWGSNAEKQACYG